MDLEKNDSTSISYKLQTRAARGYNELPLEIGRKVYLASDAPSINTTQIHLFTSTNGPFCASYT